MVAYSGQFYRLCEFWLNDKSSYLVKSNIICLRIDSLNM